MKKTIAVVLLAVMALMLVACGGGSSDPNLGRYACTTLEMSGVKLKYSDVSSKPSSITLKDGGKCVFELEETDFKGTYEISGSNITLNVDGITITGSIEDGVIEVFMDVEPSYYMIFEKR